MSVSLPELPNRDTHTWYVAQHYYGAISIWQNMHVDDKWSYTTYLSHLRLTCHFSLFRFSAWATNSKQYFTVLLPIRIYIPNFVSAIALSRANCWMLRFLKSWTSRSLHSQSSRPPTQFLGRSIFSQPKSYASLAPLRSPILSAMQPRNHGNFDLITKFKLSYADITVSKWQSRNSGLRVVHLDYDGKISLHLCVIRVEW